MTAGHDAQPSLSTTTWPSVAYPAREGTSSARLDVGVTAVKDVKQAVATIAEEARIAAARAIDMPGMARG